MLISLEETVRMIKAGKILQIAADDSLLEKLPAGKWIGGTTPYFIGEEGGISSKEKLFVNEIDFAEEVRITTYGKYNVFQIVEECYDNCLTLIIMPYGSSVAVKYAKEAPEVEELLMHPTVGWISGFDLEKGGVAKVYDGSHCAAYTDRAVVMYIRLDAKRSAMINMINIFTDDKSDPVIMFGENDLRAESCTVDGREVNFAEYIESIGADIRMPLVADYNGSYINTSIKSIENGVVNFYAPVFRNVEYRIAKPVEDYAGEFRKRIETVGKCDPFFACSCILNYMYGNLIGQKIPPFTGPVTFGEVAYQLINQTMVYCEIIGL